MKTMIKNYFMKWFLISMWVVMSVVVATNITELNIWTTPAQEWDVITANAWNELVNKAKNSWQLCSTEWSINCVVSSNSASYVNLWSCKYGFDTTTKKCKWPSWTCGSDNWTNKNGTPTNLCTLWIPSEVTDNWVWSTYAWTCNWSDWWTTASCTANHISVDIRWAWTVWNWWYDNMAWISAYKSCKAINDNATRSWWRYDTSTNKFKDWYYKIDPDWTTSTYSSFDAYCDMTTDEWWWTLVVSIWWSNRNHVNTSDAWSVPGLSSYWKFSDPKIRLIWTKDWSNQYLFKFRCESATNTNYIKDTIWDVSTSTNTNRTIYVSQSFNWTYNGFSNSCGTQRQQWCGLPWWQYYSYNDGSTNWCHPGRNSSTWKVWIK